MRELFSEIKAAGYKCTMRDGGLIIDMGETTIAVGLDESGFNAYIQIDSDSGPQYSTTEGLSKNAVIALCRQHNNQQPEIVRPEMV